MNNPSDSSKMNTRAIISFVTSLLLGPLGVFVSVPLGHSALRQIRETGERGHNLAVAGITITWVFFALAVVMFLLVLFN